MRLVVEYASIVDIYSKRRTLIPEVVLHDKQKSLGVTAVENEVTGDAENKLQLGTEVVDDNDV